jgi:hypothetical protein
LRVISWLDWLSKRRQCLWFEGKKVYLCYFSHSFLDPWKTSHGIKICSERHGASITQLLFN